MVLSKNKKQDEMSKEFLKWLEEEDPLGLDEEMEILTFTCIDCGKEDEVPDYVVGEFRIDLKDGEEVEILCPFCEGTMHGPKNAPSE